MKFLAALALSLTVAAAPCLAQPMHGRGGGRGGMEAGRPPMEAGRGGGPPRWSGQPHWGGGERPGPYGDPRGGYPSDPRGGYGYGGRGGYPDPRGGYGYPPPSQGPHRGPDSLGADWGGQQDEVRAGVRQGRYVGLARVIGNIRQHSPGRQLDAGLEQWAGRAVYRVRWAEPGGRRIDYIVDAQSGAILHVDGR
ncbi:MAG TPA: hypothetical protein VHY32_05270 [Caulobacteraceae bacterium]|jgi:hypothetical protein|nr:hypothetical protein [Caulobacteraceae bacterium]